MNQLNIKTQEEWLKVLGKGMVTLPKKWRDELSLEKGDIVRAKKEGNRVVIEAFKNTAPYRVYTSSEIDKFINDDKLTRDLVEKVEADIPISSS